VPGWVTVFGRVNHHFGAEPGTQTYSAWVCPLWQAGVSIRRKAGRVNGHIAWYTSPYPWSCSVRWYLAVGLVFGNHLQHTGSGSTLEASSRRCGIQIHIYFNRVAYTSYAFSLIWKYVAVVNYWNTILVSPLYFITTLDRTRLLATYTQAGLHVRTGTYSTSTYAMSGWYTVVLFEYYLLYNVRRMSLGPRFGVLRGPERDWVPLWFGRSTWRDWSTYNWMSNAQQHWTTRTSGQLRHISATVYLASVAIMLFPYFFVYDAKWYYDHRSWMKHSRSVWPVVCSFVHQDMYSGEYIDLMIDWLIDCDRVLLDHPECKVRQASLVLKVLPDHEDRVQVLVYTEKRLLEYYESESQ